MCVNACNDSLMLKARCCERQKHGGIYVQDKLLISPREAARLLSVSERKLWTMTFEESPGVPYVRCGRLVRYSPDDLARWIAGQQKGGDSK